MERVRGGGVPPAWDWGRGSGSERRSAPARWASSGRGKWEAGEVAQARVGRSGALDTGRVSGRASQLCLRALGNMAPRTALPDEGAKGAVRPWCRGERGGEERGDDCWRWLTRCPVCTHSADLLPLGLPPAADPPQGPLRDLLHAAQVSTSLPPSLLGSALPTVCGLLASFPRQRGDPSFWITPPLHVDAKWTAFWDTAHLPTTPLPPSPAYTRSSGPTSAWALHPAHPDAPLVTSFACPDS